MKYYLPEHEEGYARLRAEGKASWGQLHGDATFEDSEIRAVLAEALPLAKFDAPAPRALEYGCGTGPGACLLASRGMRVTGVDLSPTAIDLARTEAARRGFSIDFAVADVVAAPPAFDREFDLVVDSFCLQCIVTDGDRGRVFEFVRRALKPRGWYLIATAGFSPHRDYGRDLFDPATGIAMEPLDGPAERYEGAAVRIGERWYLPSRRHVTVDALSGELHRAGFTVRWTRVAPDDGDLAVLARFA